MNEFRSLKPALRLQIIVISLVRITFNIMYRMVYPYLGEFSRGMGVGLPELSRAFTLRSIAGGIAPLLAFFADSYGRKAGMLVGLALITLGTGALVIWPTFSVFVLAMVVTTAGYHIFVPSMQAYLGDNVPYQQRGLAMAVTEFGWSLSFIAGVPLVGLLIRRYGWSSPYPVFAALSLVGMLVLARLLPGKPPSAAPNQGVAANLRIVLATPAAWAGLAMSALMTTANESVNLVFGLWMDQAFGLKITSLGLVAVGIGTAELAAEFLVSGLVDRLGKARAIALGLVGNGLAALGFLWVGSSRLGAVVVLLLFFLCFEFAIVSGLPLMTEIVPAARATFMAANFSMFALGRAAGAALGGWLYTLSLPHLPQIGANVLFAAGLNLLALAALALLAKSAKIEHD